MNKRNVRLKLADVVAVPCPEGGYGFILFICKNQWGHGFGAFNEPSDTIVVPNKLTANVVPIYTELSPIRSGRWTIVANRPDLLSQFPSSLPIYHSKRDHPTNDLIGRYGSAEFADGEIINLVEIEANNFGLTNGTYRQIRIESEVETYLNSIVHPKDRHALKGTACEERSGS